MRTNADRLRRAAKYHTGHRTKMTIVCPQCGAVRGEHEWFYVTPHGVTRCTECTRRRLNRLLEKR